MEKILITAMVLSPIMLGGETIKPGDGDTAVFVDLEPKVFRELEAIGAVTEVVIEAAMPDDEPNTKQSSDEGSTDEQDASSTDTVSTDAQSSVEEAPAKEPASTRRTNKKKDETNG